MILASIKVPIALDYYDRMDKAIRHEKLNLNKYKNWKWIRSADIKKAFKAEVASDIYALDRIKEPCELVIRIFKKHKRKYDCGNMCIIEKFMNDAMQEFGKLIDDDYSHVVSVKTVHGGFDEDYAICEYIKV